MGEVKSTLSILIYSLGSGGAERVVTLLLPSLIKRYKVTLVLMADIIHYEIPNEVEVRLLENSTPYENGFLKLLKLPLLGLKYKKILKTRDIDISLSFMNRPNYINTLSKIFGSSAKTVISERAMPSLEYGKIDIKSRINIFLIKHLYPKADKIICNSKGNAKDLQENFSINNCEIIYNPIDLDSIDNLQNEPLDFRFEKYTYITIGRLDLGKNHGMMIDAFSKIDNKESQLLIIGTGILQKKLERQIEQLNLQNRVFLLGKQENVYKWLLRADCFLFTSKHEGFPNVILEAIACELPIISTDPQGVVSEILGSTQTIITTTDELISAMNQTKSKSNQELLHRFQLSDVSQKYIEVLG